MNKRNFIITTGAVLAFIMLATCYAAVTALRSDDVPSVTEEYRQSTLPGGGNPFLQITQIHVKIKTEIIRNSKGHMEKRWTL